MIQVSGKSVTMALELNPSLSENYVIVVDNFYRDPQAVRSFALSQDFRDGRPYYPGVRSDRRMTLELENYFNKLFNAEFDWKHEYCGVFQIMCRTDDSESYIHHDSTDWAGVLYLSEAEGPGTAFYRHKLTGFSSYPTMTEAFRKASELNISQLEVLNMLHADRKDLSKWEIAHQTEFKFNRLVLYPAKHFHKNASSWGLHKEDSRLTQVFFLRNSRT